MTPSEEMVFSLCRKSFLSLWSYANPLRAPGKELCDVLVVAGFNADESMLSDIEPQLLQDGLAWARAQAFGRPVALLEEQPPTWILDLERIRG